MKKEVPVKLKINCHIFLSSMVVLIGPNKLN
jgi:hypothetical protein